MISVVFRVLRLSRVSDEIFASDEILSGIAADCRNLQEKQENGKTFNPENYFLIAEGDTLVAIGKETGVFRDYEHSGFFFACKDKKEFIAGDASADYVAKIL